MTSSEAHQPHGADSLELDGLRILLVEDSWQLGMAMKNLLQAFGAEVAGPVATTADAERLVSEHRPDAAIVDINLRGGEVAYDLIDRLHDQGIRVVVTSGYEDVPLAPGKAAAILSKPVREEQLVESLRPLRGQKAAQ